MPRDAADRVALERLAALSTARQKATSMATAVTAHPD
jgi:hypothetical protein